MKYDDANWHYNGEFPSESPREFGGTHIALFLKWCFMQGWAGQFHLDEAPRDVQRVAEGDLAATEFFFEHCDGKLTDEDLSAEGNNFAEQYYGDDGLYLTDFADNFAQQMYVEPEEAHDFTTFASVLDTRLKTGILTEQQAKAARPWWKLF
ncbi:hypothetical protein [Pelagibius sp. Alg239-R121]|uniref:DUF7832 domain-containing protein n=1 Tax=Pelagibius sp. Alg239-R121 TaxID=2993448 RepID=UPI0024A7130F|nr:hypothetical protein [Pelagibius sp. Alg239-R121]